MTTTTNPYPNIPLPAGADFAETWVRVGAEDAHRSVFGDSRAVTDSDVIVWTSVIQLWKGRLDTDGEIRPPAVCFDGHLGNLNTDQARELAAALLEAVAEVDRWAGR
jgi:hypothetical protein